ncbi:MAG: hypothetical protein HXY40_09675 [Chloroflexi bacterium]|nr:hypothetical protein [Chloroflexota bacterium]
MADEITLRETIALARRIRQRFQNIEGREWGVEGALIELMKQVGELAKYVLVAEHYYGTERESQPYYQSDSDKIGDELADILYVIIRIADHYQIDLLDAYLQARKAEDEFLKRTGN